MSGICPLGILSLETDPTKASVWSASASPLAQDRAPSPPMGTYKGAAGGWELYLCCASSYCLVFALCALYCLALVRPICGLYRGKELATLGLLAGHRMTHL